MTLEEVKSPNNAEKQEQNDQLCPSRASLELKVRPPTAAALFKPLLEVTFTWPKAVLDTSK